MSSYYLSPIASIFQFFSDIGVPLSGGLLWTYAAGTSTPTPTYTDITGSTPNANPIQLASNGRLPNVQVWQPGGVNIKVQVSTNAGTVGSPVFGTQLGPTFDQISGINDPAATLTTLATASSGSGADLVANAMRSYDLVSSVRAANIPSLVAGQTLVIDVEGGVSVNDGLGGIYYWSSSSTAADDGGVTTIKPTAAGTTGRYVRLYGGTVSSFAGTLNGLTSTAITIDYTVISGLYAVLSGALLSTGTATTMSLSGLPAVVTPTVAASMIPCWIQNNGTAQLGWGDVTTGGVINFSISGTTTAFTTAGTNGLPSGWTVGYKLK